MHMRTVCCKCISASCPKRANAYGCGALNAQMHMRIVSEMRKCICASCPKRANAPGRAGGADAARDGGAWDWARRCRGCARRGVRGDTAHTGMHIAMRAHTEMHIAMRARAAAFDIRMRVAWGRTCGGAGALRIVAGVLWVGNIEFAATPDGEGAGASSGIWGGGGDSVRAQAPLWIRPWDRRCVRGAAGGFAFAYCVGANFGNCIRELCGGVLRQLHSRIVWGRTSAIAFANGRADTAAGLLGLDVEETARTLTQPKITVM